MIVVEILNSLMAFYFFMNKSGNCCFYFKIYFAILYELNVSEFQSLSDQLFSPFVMTLCRCANVVQSHIVISFPCCSLKEYGFSIRTLWTRMFPCSWQCWVMDNFIRDSYKFTGTEKWMVSLITHRLINETHSTSVFSLLT